MPEPLCVPAAVAAGLLSISRALFYQMNSDGRLGPQPLAFGRRRVWRVEEIRAWTAHNCPPRAAWRKIVEENRP